MTSKFLASTFSTSILALSLTPEHWNAMAFFIAAVFVGLVNLYIARTARLVAMKETRAAIAPLKEKIDAIEPKLTETREAIAPIAAKIDAITPVVESIKTHVNSEKDRAVAELAQRDLQIELQREMIAKMEAAAIQLAQARAQADLIKAVSDAAIAGATTPAPAAVVSAPVLVSIDKSAKDTAIHTKETADNTARTEKIVEGLEEHS